MSFAERSFLWAAAHTHDGGHNHGSDHVHVVGEFSSCEAAPIEFYTTPDGLVLGDGERERIKAEARAEVLRELEEERKKKRRVQRQILDESEAPRIIQGD